MDVFSYLSESSFLLFFVALLLGASIGSFLNVVVHRLPLMMYKEWSSQCNELQNDPMMKEIPEGDISLASPGSRCPSCNHAIHPLHNIPIISYLALQARCKACGARINPRYFIVELACGLLCAYIFSKYGLSWDALFIAIFTFLLVPLIFIDLQLKLLPDNITYLLLWCGVLYSLTGHGLALDSSIIGIMSGYLSLWSIYIIFKVATGKEGMGHGDFKLLAALGAWVGWQQLLPVILISSIVGTLSVIAYSVVAKGKKVEAIPFGPFLALGGWITMIWGTELTRLYFTLV